MSKTVCPSVWWDEHMNEEERAQEGESEIGKQLRDLDAYGHLTYVVGYSDGWSEDNICMCPTVWKPNAPVERPEYVDGACTKCTGREHRGDWLACFDFRAFLDEQGRETLVYHVVVNSDSGGFIECVEEGVVAPGITLADDDVPFDIVDYWIDIGMHEGIEWTEEELADAQRAAERWRADLAREIKALRGEE